MSLLFSAVLLLAVIGESAANLKYSQCQYYIPFAKCRQLTFCPVGTISVYGNDVTRHHASCLPGYFCCVGDPTPCFIQHGSDCENGKCDPATALCLCDDGYFGQFCDETVCGDENPCENDAVCINTPETDDGYKCDCTQPGSMGVNCTEYACTAAAPNDHQCSTDSVCVNLPQNDESGNLYKCDCDTGFSGEFCNIDACSPSPCGTNSVYCDYNTKDPFYECNCDSGYIGDHCETSICNDIQPCKNSATCNEADSADGYTCICLLDGNIGFDCEEFACSAASPNEHQCSSNSECSNLAQDASISGRLYECVCDDGFYGEFCDINACEPTDCSKTGAASCVKTSTSPYFQCTCGDGFVGDLCDTSICDDIQPCANDAICSPSSSSSGYTCECTADGNFGYNCTQFACEGNDCSSDSTCVNLPLDDASGDLYKCDCDVGFHGIVCQLDGCSPSLCENGQCDRIASTPYFKCTCDSGYIGELCDVHVCDYQCNDHPCTATGGAGYKCSCYPGYDPSTECDDLYEISCGGSSQSPLARLISATKSGKKSSPWTILITKGKNIVGSASYAYFTDNPYLSGQMVVTAPETCFECRNGGCSATAGIRDVANKKGSQKLSVTSVKLHESANYNLADIKSKVSEEIKKFGICVMYLDGRFSYKGDIQPACAPTLPGAGTTRKCRVAGFGHTDKNGKDTKDKRELDVEVVDSTCTCGALRNIFPSTDMADSIRCAIDCKGKGKVCQKDSGGPVYCSYDGGDYELEGILTLHDPFDNGNTCSSNTLLFTSVIDFWPWIQDQFKLLPDYLIAFE